MCVSMWVGACVCVQMYVHECGDQRTSSVMPYFTLIYSHWVVLLRPLSLTPIPLRSLLSGVIGIHSLWGHGGSVPQSTSSQPVALPFFSPLLLQCSLSLSRCVISLPLVLSSAFLLWWVLSLLSIFHHVLRGGSQASTHLIWHFLWNVSWTLADVTEMTHLVLGSRLSFFCTDGSWVSFCCIQLLVAGTK